jgi:hypothetical protein
MAIIVHPPKYGVETAEHFVRDGEGFVYGISGYLDGKKVQTWTGEDALSSAKEWYDAMVNFNERAEEFAAVTYGDKTILDEAKSLVYGDRNKQYGHPKDDYAKVATMWSAFLGVEITPHQAASMMIFIKMSRLAHEPKRDTIVDIAGYAEVVARILDMDE